jgi:Fe-S-cluster containining protein
MQQQPTALEGIGYKQQLLRAVYGVYSPWVERFPLACKKGCAACCTQSVTMTSMEGEMILDFVRREGREKWLLEKLDRDRPGKSTAAMTTNHFAKACLDHQEVCVDNWGSWDFTPCIFLVENTCSIYEVRPFGCRSFGSFVKCGAGRAAEIAPRHLAVNTVFTQIIEHVSSDGGYWATMNDILLSLADCNTQDWKIHLLPAQPVPGFLIEPHEKHTVKTLLKQLREKFSEKGVFGDLIDNCMPI